MPAKSALIDYRSCHPDRCGKGRCAAAPTCPRGLLSQEEAYDIPWIDPTLCRGCGDCTRTCPLRAIRISDS